MREVWGVSRGRRSAALPGCVRWSKRADVRRSSSWSLLKGTGAAPPSERLARHESNLEPSSPPRGVRRLALAGVGAVRQDFKIRTAAKPHL